MTVTNTQRSVAYVGNGATTVFPFAFHIPNAASLKVVLAEIATGALTEITAGNYSVTGLGNPSGGSVTYPLVGSPITSTHRIAIYREMPVTQEVVVSNQTAYYADVAMRVWDDHIMIMQELRDDTNRAVKVPIGSEGTAAELTAQLTADITAVSSKIPEITSVSANMSKVQSIYNNMAAVQNVDQNMSAVAAASGSVVHVTYHSFAGDGTTTVFSLGEPIAAAENIFVWLNGVHKDPVDDYTVTASTVIFAVAPGAGVEVRIANLGLVSMADVQAEKDQAAAYALEAMGYRDAINPANFATVAQGTKADNALPATGQTLLANFDTIDTTRAGMYYADGTTLNGPGLSENMTVTYNRATSISGVVLAIGIGSGRRFQRSRAGGSWQSWIESPTALARQETVDANNAVKSGPWRLTSACANLPIAASNYNGFVSAISDNDLVQEFMQAGANTKWYRRRVSGTWGNWTRVIDVDNLAANLNASGSAPIFACRAWACYDAVTPVMQASGNVASITRTTTGEFTVTFSTAMPDANYAVVVGLGVTATSFGVALLRNPTTTGFQLVTARSNENVSRANPAFISLAVFR